jgi:hypothetical protein
MTAKTYDVKPCPQCDREIRKRAKLCGRCYGRNTPQARDKHPLCGAKRKNGEPCRNWAGVRTSHPGIGCCWLHGGNSPSGEKAALALEVKRRMVTLAEPLSEQDASPHRVLANLMRMAGGNVEWLDAEIRKLEDLGTADAAAKLALYTQEREMTARVAKLASEAGVEQVEANLKQAQAVMMPEMVKTAAEQAGLNDKQVNALGVGLRKLAFEARGDSAGADAEAARLADLREQIDAEQEQRIADAARVEAERLSGLTLPLAEWLPEV